MSGVLSILMGIIGVVFTLIGIALLWVVATKLTGDPLLGMLAMLAVAIGVMRWRRRRP